MGFQCCLCFLPGKGSAITFKSLLGVFPYDQTEVIDDFRNYGYKLLALDIFQFDMDSVGCFVVLFNYESM